MRVRDISAILKVPLDDSLWTTSYLGQTYALTLGDFDANGRLDLFLNNHALAPSVLLRDFAFDGGVDRIDFATNVDEHGATFFDVDQDGDLDLLDAAGGREGRATDPNDRATWTHVFTNDDGVLGTRNISADIGLTYPLSRSRMLVPVNFDGEIGLFNASGVRPDRLYPPVFWKLQDDGTYTEWTRPGIVPGQALFGLTAHLGTDTSADFIVYGGDLVRLFEKPAGGTRYVATRLATGDGPISDIAVADFDGDRRPEVLVAQDDTGSNLYRENAAGVWKEIGAARGLGASKTGTHGLTVGDFDNDGDQDFATLLDVPGLAIDFWKNNGQGRFTVQHYVDTTVRGRGQNIASGDFDNDGLIDFIAGTGNGSGRNAASAGEYVVLKSLPENSNKWLSITLEGTVSETSGLGARVYLTTPNGRIQMLEQDSGAHDWMQDDQRLHFGLGQFASASVRIVWPDGHVQVERGLAANRHHVIEENRGVVTIDRDGSRVVVSATSPEGRVSMDGALVIDDFAFTNVRAARLEAGDTTAAAPTGSP